MAQAGTSLMRPDGQANDHEDRRRCCRRRIYYMHLHNISTAALEKRRKGSQKRVDNKQGASKLFMISSSSN